jgi:putative transposase
MLQDHRMARLGRIVAAGFPHHVTQRGNRREAIFFGPADYALYRDLLAERCRKASVEVWAYCLMPNHVHLVLVPSTADGLSRAIGETHRQYTGFINARARWTGHLFQGRFSSVALDEAHLIAAARYVALNPVRAGLVARPQDWEWSSARAHLDARDDALVRVAPLLDRNGRFADLVEGEIDRLAFAALRANEGTCRPLGSDEFVAAVERATGRRLRPARPGPKPRVSTNQSQLSLPSADEA